MKRGTPDHPKTLALMQALSIPRPMAVGLLELLWHFTARYSPRGDIGRWPDEYIAKAVEWDGEAGALMRALIESGWIDPDSRHRYLVHDWSEHADEATKKSLARNGLRFAGKSRRRRDTVETQSRPPEPEPQPEPGQSRSPTRATRRRSRIGELIRAADAEARGVEAVIPSGDPPTGADYIPVEVARCPDCHRVAVIREAARYLAPGEVPGWVCWKKNDGCGTKFDVGAREILEQLPPRQREQVSRSVERILGPPAPKADPAAAEKQSAAEMERAEGLAGEFIAAGAPPVTIGGREISGLTNWLMEKLGPDEGQRIAPSVSVALRRLRPREARHAPSPGPEAA